jgi:2,4-dienoyl-CoA reductase (NADPH2)
LRKAFDGTAETINTCIACNQACLDHAFVGRTASCLVNPAACHEEELTPYLLPESQRLTIGVVGAGPAGCSFALTAAQMGHSVTLYDKGDKVGGQFHMAKRMYVRCCTMSILFCR